MKDSNTRKKIIIIAATLFLLLLVVEGVVCVFLFRPKHKDNVDKKLVAMLDEYCRAVNSGDGDAMWKLFDLGEGEHWYDLTGRDRDGYATAFKVDNEGISDLTYRIIGIYDESDEGCIATVKFSYMKEGEDVQVVRDVPVVKGDEYRFSTGIAITGTSFDEDMLETLLVEMEEAVANSDVEKYLSLCIYDKAEEAVLKEEVSEDYKRITSLELVAGEYSEINAVGAYLLRGTMSRLALVDVNYIMDYDLRGEVVKLKGTLQLCVVPDEDHYRFLNVPSFIVYITNEE